MASPTGSNDPLKPSDAPPAAEARPEKKIGKYEIQKKIGAGGMGAVYLALDPMLNRVCALKVLPKDKARNPTLVRRFKAEAQAAANLRHENIVTIYEAGEADGFLYIALEYVEGTDIARLVDQRGVIPQKRSIEIVRQVAQALDHASQKGIVHRDIKPGNLLVRRDGMVKLADLGLARSLDESVDTSITRAGTTVGTVDYMSPEQARDSKAADVRSDIYSLGCTWYYMLTGRPPFPDGSLTNKLRAHAETAIPDPRGENPAVSEAVCGVLRRMTEKKPGKRYQTPGELLADLEAVSLNNDIVSDTILSELSEETNGASTASYRKPKSKNAVADAEDDSMNPPAIRAARAAPAVDAAAPVFKPPPGRDKPVPDGQRKKKNNAALFYGLIGLLLVGVVVAIISMVKDINGSADSPQGDIMASPFANAEAAKNAAGPAADGTKSITGNANSAAQVTGAYQTPKTTITSENPDDRANPGFTGQNAPPVDSGPRTTRITGEGDKITTETVGGRSSGTGADAGPGPGAASNAGTGGQTGSDVATGNSTAPGGAGKTGGRTGPGASAAPSAARTKQETSFIHEWARKQKPVADLPTILVTPGSSGEGQFSTLNQALQQVPAGGAVIQLLGNGPFVLFPVKVTDKSRVVIKPKEGSAAGNPPLIVLLPPEEGSVSNFLEFTNTALELQNVHLALDATGFSTDPDDSLISAIASDVSLQNCSLSVKGVSNSPMTALKLSGNASHRDEKTGRQMRVQIDNALIRGNCLTGLLVNSEHLELTVRNSLIWSGSAPALRFGTMARSDADSGRTLRLASTTVCSQVCGVQMNGDASHPVPTSMALLNSLVAAPAGGKSPVLLDLQDWNLTQQKAALGKFFTWKSTDSLYTGWTNLIQLDPGGVAAAKTPTEWQNAWKDKAPGDKDQFQAALWPTAAIPDIAVANFDALIPQSIGKQYVKTSDGGWPGCMTETLFVVNLEALETAQTAAVRPAIPRGLFGFTARETLTVDASKEDLGKFLKQKKLQTGTEIVVSGSGIVQSSPIVVQDVWVRLTFRPSEGAPLVLTPRSAETKYEGFISIENGGLEINGGVFTIPASDRQTPPKWFIHVVDGDLAMWHCRVQGPMVGTTRNKGLFHFRRSSGRPPARMFDGNYEGYAAFVDCFLTSSGTLLDADMYRRALFLRNCIAVSRDDILDLSIREPDSQINGVVDLYYSTLSAVDRIIHVEGADLQTPAELPLAIYADRCVYAPPLRAAQQKVSPTLFSFSGHVLDQRQVAWWENRCGYAAEITQFLRTDSESSATGAQDFEKVWVDHWGPSQVSNPLSGSKAIVLKVDLPTEAKDRAKLEPVDFQLHPSARASTWDGSQHQIGAYVDSMKLVSLRGTGSSPAKTKPVKSPSVAPATPGF